MARERERERATKLGAAMGKKESNQKKRMQILMEINRHLFST
jgi:hypothetical protein